MRSDGKNNVLLTIYFEIETLSQRHSALPYVLFVAIFLGLQRRMAGICEQKSKLFRESFFDVHRKGSVVLVRPFREAQSHLRGLFRRLARRSNSLIAAPADV